MHIVLNAHLAKRSDHRRDWLSHTREEFHELEFPARRKVHKLPVVLQDEALLVRQLA